MLTTFEISIIGYILMGCLITRILLGNDDIGVEDVGNVVISVILWPIVLFIAWQEKVKNCRFSPGIFLVALAGILSLIFVLLF